MTIEPLHRANFVDQAYQAIKQMMVSGELAPGSPLNIDALARRLGVSNSPIREALRRLEYERWIETVPFRGSFARPLDETELTELYEFRQIIEAAAIDKLMSSGGPYACAQRQQQSDQMATGVDPAADCLVSSDRSVPSDRTVPSSDRSVRFDRSVPPDHAAPSECAAPEAAQARTNHDGPTIRTRRLDILREIVAEIDAAVRDGDAMRYLQADARFHQTIVDMAGNRRLSDLFRTLVEQGRSFMLGRTPEAMARCREEPDEHARLLEAIERGEKSKARMMLEAHLRISLDDIRKITPHNEG